MRTCGIDTLRVRLPFQAISKLKKEKELKAWVNIDTGELGDYLVWDENALKVVIKGDLYGYMIFSVPRMIRGTNNAYLTLEGIVKSLDSITDQLGLSIRDWRVENIEFGMDIKLSLSSSQVLSFILSYRHHDFGVFSDRLVGQGKVLSLNEYSVKFYDKGKELGLHYADILRMEVRIKKTRKISRDGKPVFVRDIETPACHEELLKSLLKVWEHVEIVDDSLFQFAKENEAQELEFWFNPVAVNRLRAMDHKRYMARYNRYRKLVKRLRKKGPNLHSQIKETIRQGVRQDTDLCFHHLDQG